MNELDPLVRRHLKIGWWSLCLWLTLGIALEALHALKLGWYLDVGSETRRLLFTLAHAHGTLLALIHLGYAATLRRLTTTTKLARAAGSLLSLASLLLPTGFLLGGVKIYGGDPGPGIFLVPVGALALLIGVACVALAVTRAPPNDGAP
jgi:hypothetical protein